MRALVQRPLAFAALGLAAVLPVRVLAQADASAASPGAASSEPVEEVTVQGRKTLTQYRLEIEQARDEVFRLYNEANEGKDNDITCRAEQPTGSRVRQQVCRSEAENKAHAAAAFDFLTGLVRSAGNFNEPAAPPGTQVVANIDTGEAQGGGQTGQADALAQFEAEWKRLLGENRQLFRAVVKYAELQDEYDRARGATTGPTEQDLTVLLEDPIAPAGAAGPQCEATTLTEYQQRNNVARVTGTVSLANCAAGTTGSFTLVARVRDDNGETRPLEFNESWQRADAQDHRFSTDYPIGDNVELMTVRVRDLKCTCADPAQ
jgi:hypothetical protein